MLKRGSLEVDGEERLCGLRRFGEMGTKVQSKIHLPGYNFIRDLNEDANGGWSRYYDHTTQSGHLYGGCMLGLVNGYAGYDKETLKRIMLEQEAIFRKQVYELHRLYRIQKSLMDELRRNEYHRVSVQVDATQANSFSSHMPTDSANKMQQMPCLPITNTSHSGTSAAGHDHVRNPLNFLEESSLYSSKIPIEKRGTLKHSGHLVSGLKSSPMKMFELQLPADLYIKSEVSERSEKDPVAKSLFRVSTSVDFCSDEPDNDVKLTLGTCENPNFGENNRKTDSHMTNASSTLSLANLNAPVKDMAGSALTKTSCPEGHSEGIQEHLLSVKSQTIFTVLQGNVFRDRHKDEGTNFNFLHEENVEEMTLDWPHFKNKSGQSKSNVNSCSPLVCYEKLPTPFGSVEVMHKRTHETLLPEHNEREAWFSPHHDDEIFERGRTVANSNNLRMKMQTPGFYSIAPISDNDNAAPPHASSLTKPRNGLRHVPFAVQALPCVNAFDKWHSNGSMKSAFRVGEYSYPNGFRHDPISDPNSASHKQYSLTTSGKQILDDEDGTSMQFQKCCESSQCTIMKSAKDLNLNQTLPNGTQNGLTAQQELPVGISWLRNHSTSVDSFESKKPAFEMKLGFSNGYCQLLSSLDAVAKECKKNQEKVSFPSNTQNVASDFLVKESEITKNEASDIPRSIRIRDFTTINQIQDNALLSPSILCQERSSAVEKPSFRTLINLNSAETRTGYQDESEISPGGNTEVPSPLSRSNVGTETASQIDLERPISTQPGENVLAQEQFIGQNCLVLHTEMPSSKISSSWAAEYSHDTLITEAAENIIAISLDTQSHESKIICCPSSPALCNSLHWFADVTSNAECGKDARAGESGASETSEDDGLDLFESMTLKLKETNVDEYLHRSPEQENQKGDAKGATSLLLAKPRRGQARKRRQRRDFQKDILPGLASLSRHEVTEDLQTIGGLLRASGRSWQINVTRRNMGQHKLQSQVKGTRRPRSLAVTISQIHAPPPQAPLITTEFKVDGKHVIGWGRTTRRCRRPRCPAGNISVPNLKV